MGKIQSFIQKLREAEIKRSKERASLEFKKKKQATLNNPMYKKPPFNQPSK